MRLAFFAVLSSLFLDMCVGEERLSYGFEPSLERAQNGMLDNRIIIKGVHCDGPLAHVLRTGDEIVAINGISVPAAKPKHFTQIRAILQEARQPISSLRVLRKYVGQEGLNMTDSFTLNEVSPVQVRGPYRCGS